VGAAAGRRLARLLGAAPPELVAPRSAESAAAVGDPAPGPRETPLPAGQEASRGSPGAARAAGAPDSSTSERADGSLQARQLPLRTPGPPPAQPATAPPAALEVSGAASNPPSARREGNPQAEPQALAAPEGPPAQPARPPPLTRRAFVEQATVGSALLIGGGSAAYGGLFGRHDYDLATVAVPIPGLAKAADGFTIVQLSDIHVGQMVGEAELRAAEELVRKAKGDLIVLTGDLVDHDVRYAERLGRLVRRLSEIRPVVAVPGNHDYYTGVDAVLGAVRAAGGTTLVNQATTMLGERAGFVLAGLDDLWAEGHVDGSLETRNGPDLAAALAGVRSEAPRIVLCHNPKVFLATAGEIALQLSGHTHGGQVNLGFRPVSVVLGHGYIAGLYETKGSRIYVNRGFGTAGPAVRVGAPPEVTRIVLVSA
jgi:uncharacterized protein